MDEYNAELLAIWESLEVQVIMNKTSYYYTKKQISTITNNKNQANKRKLSRFNSIEQKHNIDSDVFFAMMKYMLKSGIPDVCMDSFKEFYTMMMLVTGDKLKVNCSADKYDEKLRKQNKNLKDIKKREDEIFKELKSIEDELNTIFKKAIQSYCDSVNNDKYYSRAAKKSNYMGFIENRIIKFHDGKLVPDETFDEYCFDIKVRYMKVLI